MKLKSNYLIAIAIIVIMVACSSNKKKENKYFGELPGIAAEFETKLDALEKEVKESTDLEEAFKLDKEHKQLKEKAKEEIDLYANSFTFPSIPFKNLEANPFTILKISVNNVSRSRVNLKGKVKIKEDLKNKYGGFEKSFFAYIKAADENGKILGKPTVMASDMGNRGPFTSGTEVEIFGSISPLSQFENFHQLIFITKDEYQQNK